MLYLTHLSKMAAMHIPDGFLSLPVSLVFWGISIVLIGIAVRKTRESFGERQAPLMGVMAAFIFAAQMINFPVAGGTSGHLLGGALAAIVLGPWAGMLVMTTVIFVQGLLFQDGGLLAMGANIFNMGLLTALIGFGVYRLHGIFGRQDQRVRWLFAGLAAWLSVVAGALSTSLQLWLSGTSVLAVVLPAMLGVHALIGAGEALITSAALIFIFRTQPDLLKNEVSGASERRWMIGGVLASLGVLLLSPLASAYPDGLERVASNLGFINRSAEAPFLLLPDYTIPFLGETPFSTIAAGLAGTIAVAALIFLAVRLIGRPRRA